MSPISGVDVYVMTFFFFAFKKVDEIVKFNNDKNSSSLGRPLMTNHDQPTVGAQGNIQTHK